MNRGIPDSAVGVHLMELTNNAQPLRHNPVKPDDVRSDSVIMFGMPVRASSRGTDV